VEALLHDIQFSFEFDRSHFELSAGRCDPSAMIESTPAARRIVARVRRVVKMEADRHPGSVG